MCVLVGKAEGEGFGAEDEEEVVVVAAAAEEGAGGAGGAVVVVVEGAVVVVEGAVKNSSTSSLKPHFSGSDTESHLFSKYCLTAAAFKIRSRK